MTRTAIVALALLLLAAGCSGATLKRFWQSGDNGRRAARACLSWDHAAVANSPPRWLAGDVTGDARADEVSITGRRARAGACRYFLVVRSTDGIAVARILLAGVEPTFDGSAFGVPALAVLADIDRHPGLEPVVVVWRGASTEFAGVFTMRSGTLRRMRIAGARDNAFAYAGSVMHANAVDCARGAGSGLVRTVSAGRAGAGYDVEATLMRVEGLAFRVVAARSERWSLRRLERSPLFRTDQPFGSCGVVSAS